MTKEELEKEKCRLERKLEQTEKDLADYQFNYPTIKELQEENERLKKSNLEMLSFYEKKLNKNIELEKQIEKMKCCGNCSHRHYWGNELGCNLDLDKQFECDNNNKKYWEFKAE